MAEKKSYFDFLLCCASGACPPCLHHRRIAHVMHPGALSDRRQDGHRRVHDAAEAAQLLLPRRPARRGDPAHGASRTSSGGAVWGGGAGAGGSLSCCARSRGCLPLPMGLTRPTYNPPPQFKPFSIIGGEKSIVGSMIGGTRAMADMLAFSAEHKCFPQVRGAAAAAARVPHDATTPPPPPPPPPTPRVGGGD
jgi:hypothetical protein